MLPGVKIYQKLTLKYSGTHDDRYIDFSQLYWNKVRTLHPFSAE
jgi:hypothetical protein